MADELAPGEAFSLASEMAKEYAAMVHHYRKLYGVTAPEAEQKTQELLALGAGKDLALTLSPDQVTWWNLGELTGEDPQKAVRAWARLKAEARAELASGHRTAKAAEGFCVGPWARAQVLAIRDAMIADWQPRPGIEQALVETLATAQSGYLFWLERLMMRASSDAQMEEADLNAEGKWRPTRIPQAAATEEAAVMMDRFNRVFLRTLRALRDLRRYSPNVTITGAQQVNIGQQQVNVASPVGDVGEVKGAKSD